MIKLFSVKKKADEEKKSGRVKQSAGELRVQKDISELNLPKGASVDFLEGKDNLMHFRITLRPEEGLWRGGAFLFDFRIDPGYSHVAPKVKCLTKVFHPNLDLEGNICLNILREDWKPVLTINSVVYGLNFLFLDPNPDDPLNKDAAQSFVKEPSLFARQAQQAISRGANINGTFFPPCAA